MRNLHELPREKEYNSLHEFNAYIRDLNINLDQFNVQTSNTASTANYFGMVNESPYQIFDAYVRLIFNA